MFDVLFSRYSSSMLGLADHMNMVRRHSTTSIMSSEVKNVGGDKGKIEKQQSKSAWGKVT